MTNHRNQKNTLRIESIDYLEEISDIDTSKVTGGADSFRLGLGGVELHVFKTAYGASGIISVDGENKLICDDIGGGQIICSSPDKK